MLHGYPGGPTHMLDALGLSVDEDLLVTVHRLTPLIVVSPTGSPSFIGNDKEWANGVGPANAWETYLTRDVVQAIDRTFRTIPTGAGRAIAGLSEGAYGALNVGLHHPGEFRVIEAWSPYVRAESTKTAFGGRPGLIAFNSPLVYLPKVAAQLRAAHTYIWFYVGTRDGKLYQNQQFANELTRLGVDHRFFILSGGHNWALWRPHVEQALIVISQRLAHA
jgi:S-formylglutathione hydrolase FrmB